MIEIHRESSSRGSKAIIIGWYGGRDLGHHLSEFLVAPLGGSVFQPFEFQDPLFECCGEQLLDGNMLLRRNFRCTTRPDRYFQDTIVIRVWQRRSPTEIDLDQPRPATEVLDKFVNVLQRRVAPRCSALQYGFV